MIIFHCGYDEAKLNDIMSGQNTKAILDAHGDQVLCINIYALNVPAINQWPESAN